MSLWVRKHPLLVFFILAIVITFLVWLPQTAYSRGLFPFDSPLFYIIGGIGPMIAAYLVLRIEYGDKALDKLFAPLLNWKVNVVWYIIALVGFPLISLVAAFLAGNLLHSLNNLNLSPALFMTFFTYLIAAIPEEVAWRGFALPRLQYHFNALVSSLILGMFWALWHLPLLYNTTNVMSTYPKYLFVIQIISAAVIYTWLFNSTYGSALIVTIYHTFVNVFGSIMDVDYKNLTIVMVVSAILITLVFGPANLSFPEKPTLDDELDNPTSYE